MNICWLLNKTMDFDDMCEIWAWIHHKNWLKIEKSRKISETADVTLENLKRKGEQEIWLAIWVTIWDRFNLVLWFLGEDCKRHEPTLTEVWTIYKATLISNSMEGIVFKVRRFD